MSFSTCLICKLCLSKYNRNQYGATVSAFQNCGCAKIHRFIGRLNITFSIAYVSLRADIWTTDNGRSVGDPFITLNTSLALNTGSIYCLRMRSIQIIMFIHKPNGQESDFRKEFTPVPMIFCI